MDLANALNIILDLVDSLANALNIILELEDGFSKCFKHHIRGVSRRV